MIIVERIEGEIAVLELDDGSKAEIALKALPIGVHEGSVLQRTSDGYALDIETEEKRRATLAARTKRLFK